MEHSLDAAVAPKGDGDDREFVQVREPDVSVNVVGMEADGVAGDEGTEEGEREREERAEGRGGRAKRFTASRGGGSAHAHARRGACCHAPRRRR